MLPFARRGLRVLMYHKVSAAAADALTVTTAQLAEQLAWLRARGADFVSLGDVRRAHETGAVLPRWPVLVTFDDGYVDTLELAQPVLQRLGVRAAVFVPGAFIGQASSWDREARPLMNAAQLRALAREGWEIALHSHRHVSYAQLSAAGIAADVRENFSALRAAGVEPVPALAYPFGHRPRATAERAAMFRALIDAGVPLAFRIGNRINPLPLAAPLEINRLDVRGDRSFGAFRRKIHWGRLL